MKRISLFTLGAAALLVVVSCAKPPESDIQQAREAVQVAQDAGAPTYATDSWNRTREAEDALEAELEAQGGKFSLFRSYRKAAELAQELAAAARQAGTEATRRTAEMRSDLTATIAELRGLLQTARNRLAAVPATVRLDRAGLQARLRSAAERIDRAQRDLEAGGFDAAMAATAEARESLRTVLRTIDTAVPPAPTRKR